MLGQLSSEQVFAKKEGSPKESLSESVQGSHTSPIVSSSNSSWERLQVPLFGHAAFAKQGAPLELQVPNKGPFATSLQLSSQLDVPPWQGALVVEPELSPSSATPSLSASPTNPPPEHAELGEGLQTQLGSGVASHSSPVPSSSQSCWFVFAVEGQLSERSYTPSPSPSSQASPTPFPSLSNWFAFAMVGQLSFISAMPSPSASASWFGSKRSTYPVILK